MNRHTTFASPYLLGFGPAHHRGGERHSTTRSASAQRTARRRLAGKQAQPGGKMFPRRAMAMEHFLRGFVRCRGTEVSAAALENGLLKNDLARRQIRPSVRTVKVKIGGLS